MRRNESVVPTKRQALGRAACAVTQKPPAGNPSRKPVYPLMYNLINIRPKQICQALNSRKWSVASADIPQMADWSKAVGGKFYRPIKKSLTIRMDADVVAWLRPRERIPDAD